MVKGLTQTGVSFLIDLEDFDKVKQHYWYENDQGYIVSNIGRNKFIRLHRLVLQAKPDEIIDHINRNKSDNRRCNLRFANKQLNSINRGASRNNATKIKGVQKSANGERFVARICVNGKTHHLGTFDTADEARRVREQKEKELFGEFAFSNNQGGV